MPMQPSLIYFFSAIILLCFGSVLAQEDSIPQQVPPSFCEYPFFEETQRIEAKAVLLDNEGNSIHLEILWKHAPQTLDTFMLSNTHNQQYVHFITNGQERWAYSGPQQHHKRRMAAHHLREELFATSLRYDDLELLAKGAFICPDSAQSRPRRLRTALSESWSQLVFSDESPPQSLTMSNRNRSRQIRFKNWETQGSMRFPHRAEFSGREYIQITHVETITTLPYPASVTDPVFMNDNIH